MLLCPGLSRGGRLGRRHGPLDLPPLHWEPHPCSSSQIPHGAQFALAPEHESGTSESTSTYRERRETRAQRGWMRRPEPTAMKRRPGVRRWTLPHLLQVIFGDLNANDQTNATPADIRDTSEKRAEAIGQNRSTRILAIQHLQSVNNRTRCNSRLSASHVLACLSRELGLASVLEYATSLCFLTFAIVL